MTTEGMIILAMGIGFLLYGGWRARGFWSAYRALADSRANIERYERWRGGVRGAAESGPTDEMKVLRRRMAVYALVALFGLVFIAQALSYR